MPIPTRMKETPRWVLWDWVEREGKPTKVPKMISGEWAKSTDPNTWTTYELAAQHEADHAGLAFVFSKEDDICGIDLDSCYREGQLAPWAAEILALCGDTYVEISPSGSGLKIFGTYSGEIRGNRMNVDAEPYSEDKEPGFERYDWGRFFTVTEHEGRSPRSELRDLSAAMAHLDAMLGDRADQAEPVGYEGPGGEEKPERLEGLLRLDPGLYDRWCGITRGLKDTSASGIDQSIADLLAFYGMAGGEIEQSLRWRRREADLPAKHDGYYRSTVGKALAWAEQARAREEEARKRAEPLGHADPVHEDAPQDERGLEESDPEAPEDGPERLFWVKDVVAMDLDIEWLADGILPAVGLSCIAAKPKVGKSTLARDLARAVGTGERWLDAQTHAGDVLYVDADGSLATLKRHYEASGEDASWERIAVIHPKWGELGPQIEAALNAQPFSLLVIDTLQTVLRIKDLNDYAEVGRAFAYLRSEAERRQIHICLVHHDRKAGGDSGDGTLGSTAIFGGVDTLLTATRDGEGVRVIRTIQRDGEDMEPTELVYEDGVIKTMGRAAEKPKGGRAKVDRDVVRDELLAYVAEHPGCRKAIVLELDGLPGGQQVRRAVIELLCHEGAIFQAHIAPEGGGRPQILLYPAGFKSQENG